MNGFTCDTPNVVSNCSDQVKRLASYLPISVKKVFGNVVFAEAGLYSDVGGNPVCPSCHFSFENMDKGNLNLKDVCRIHLSDSPNCSVALKHFKALNCCKTFDQVKSDLYELAAAFAKQIETSANVFHNEKDFQQPFPSKEAAQAPLESPFVSAKMQFHENSVEKKHSPVDNGIVSGPKLNGVNPIASAKHISDKCHRSVCETGEKMTDLKVWGDGGIDANKPSTNPGYSKKNEADENNFSEMATALKLTSDQVTQEQTILHYRRSADARRKTFAEWPSGSPVKPEDLAEAGFIYTGKEDNTRCVFCSGMLCQWEAGDVPELEHSKHFPACKKTNFKQKIEFDSSRETATGANYRVSGKKSAGNSSMTLEEIVQKMQTLEEANHILKERRLCKLCLDRDIDTVFLPCGHLVSCKECAPKISKCAICRTLIRGTVLAFIPAE